MHSCSLQTCNVYCLGSLRAVDVCLQATDTGVWSIKSSRSCVPFSSTLRSSSGAVLWRNDGPIDHEGLSVRLANRRSHIGSTILSLTTVHPHMTLDPYANQQPPFVTAFQPYSQAPPLRLFVTHPALSCRLMTSQGLEGPSALRPMPQKPGPFAYPQPTHLECLLDSTRIRHCKLCRSYLDMAALRPRS